MVEGDVHAKDDGKNWRAEDDKELGLLRFGTSTTLTIDAAGKPCLTVAKAVLLKVLKDDAHIIIFHGCQKHICIALYCRKHGLFK